MGIRTVVPLIFIAASTLIAGCSIHSTSPHLESKQQTGMDHKKHFFVAHKGIEDDYEIIFHVMPAPEGNGFSRVQYHLMVSVQKDGSPVTGLILKSSVKHPDGSVEPAAPMMRMGNWYMALYNLSHEKGQHWLTVSFEKSGKTYSSGVYYPERPYLGPTTGQ